MQKQTGQVAIILLLIIVVSLAVGLSVASRSLTEITNASKTEDSSRAYFAAEAGIEKALSQGTTGAITGFENQATANVLSRGNIPAANQALEYPAQPKEQTAQVWLADPGNLTVPYYSQSELDIYFGNLGVATTDTPALNANLVYKNSDGSYGEKRYFIDPITSRRASNGFPDPNADFSLSCNPEPVINTSFSASATAVDRSFHCKATIRNFPTTGGAIPMLIRSRILYSTTNQALAFGPVGGCGAPNCSLPPQAKIYTTIGQAGQSQRVLQLFKLDYVVPQMFDYAIFSAGDITK